MRRKIDGKFFVVHHTDGRIVESFRLESALCAEGRTQEAENYRKQIGFIFHNSAYFILNHCLSRLYIKSK